MAKLKETIINKQIIEKTLIIFLMLQPLLDFAFLFKEKVVKALKKYSDVLIIDNND